MKKNFRKIKISVSTFWIALILFSSKVFGDDLIDSNSDYIYEGQVLTGSALSDIISHRIHRILIIIIFSVLIINLYVILKTKDKEKRKKTKKVSIIVTFGAVLISIIYDFISLWAQSGQTVYGVPADIEMKSGGKPTYPENAVYSLPEPKTSAVNVVINLAQWIIPVITFIIGIVSLIGILMTKDKELKKKRIRKTIIVLSVLIVLIIGISIAARFLNN